MINNRVKVTHDEVGEVSIACGSRYYGDDERNFVEIAFFDKKNKWYLTPVEPFEQYQETTGTTCIYAWVPTELVEEWLIAHGAPTDIKSLPYSNDTDIFTELLGIADIIEGRQRPKRGLKTSEE